MKNKGLFEEQTARKPNNYPWTQEFIDAIWKGFWTPNEFDFRSDFAQFKTDLTEEEQGVVVRTLSAIGQIEVAVKTFWADLGKNFKHPSISDLGYVMAQSEVIHSIAYEKLLDKLQLLDVFEENLKHPAMKGRVEYLKKHLKKVYGEDKRKQYIYSIILFTLFVENVSLFSQFYIILWFNRFHSSAGSKLLKDTAQQIQYTRNEEMLHSQVGIKLINTLRVEYPELFDEDLEEIIRHEAYEAIKSESKIIAWILGGFSGKGCTQEILETFIAARLDESLVSIGFRPLDGRFDPELLEQTEWMDEETLGNNLTDFFSQKPVEYAKGALVYSEEELF